MTIRTQHAEVSMKCMQVIISLLAGLGSNPGRGAKLGQANSGM